MTQFVIQLGYQSLHTKTKQKLIADFFVSQNPNIQCIIGRLTGDFQKVI
jgi:hypothetical protein